ncbi:NUDIX domain-containing protein [Streptomyces sp. NPDC056362]|uniref:NUDIX domain-containing protein n=1 Tax=unclassified Streptomyces TaxID=2593676 RepID=UPI0035DB1E32
MPTAAPPTRSSPPTTLQRGTSRAIYAVTGVVDEVHDLIVPGAFARTLAARPVKTVWHHGWKDPIGIVVLCEEWMPGDPRFADVPGEWPAEAGALVCDVVYNLRTRQGRDAYEQVLQWHKYKQAAFSIGYRVPDASASKRSDGVRVIHDLDLFEVSPVLHGAHPLTRSLEVKSALGDRGEGGELEYKSTPSHLEVDVAVLTEAEDVKVAGLAVKAADTGRILMIQRALDEEDPAAGTWEIPGGHLEKDEEPLTAAVREWSEETGSTLPATASVVGSWTAPNGIYRGFVAVVPAEASLPINIPHSDRTVENPDDLKGEATEVTAWWPIAALPKMPLLRPECRTFPWDLLAGATLPQGPTGQQPAPAVENVLESILAATRGGAGPATEEKSARAAVRAARAVPRIEHKSARSMVAEAKSRIPIPLETAMPSTPLPESQEQFRTRLADAVRSLLSKDGGPWTCIEGTYVDHVIVSVHSEEEATSRHYSIPYTVTAGGEITLDKPQPVELATVVVPEGSTGARATTAAEDVDARVVQPTVGALADATARVSTSTAGPEQLEDIGDRVRGLIAALSAKGLEIDEDAPRAADRPPAARTPGLDLWDEDTFLDEDDEDDDGGTPPEAAAPGEGEPPAPGAPDEEDDDRVSMDPAEVKALLASFRS